MTPFPSITAENQTLRSKKQGKQRFNYAFYTVPTRISEPKIFRTSYSADTNVLEQEKIWACYPTKWVYRQKNAERTYCLAFFRVPPLAASSLAPFEPWGRRKSAKSGLER